MRTRKRWGNSTVHDAVQRVMSWVQEDLRSAHGPDFLGMHFVVRHEIEENGLEIVSLGLDSMEPEGAIESIIRFIRATRPMAAISTEAQLNRRGDVESIVVVVQHPDFSVQVYQLDCDRDDDTSLERSFRLVSDEHIDEGKWFPLTLAGWERTTRLGVWSACLEGLPYEHMA